MSISVIIPAYNAQDFLAETLESLMQQTLMPDEVLVIDDGSTDATAAIADRFAPLVRVLRQSHIGQVASRNLGVQQATSEWIAFLDADDLWKPNKLELQMAELARHPEADLCYCARIHFAHGTSKRITVVPVPAAQDIRKALFRNTTFLPSSVVIRRSTFQAHGGFDTFYRQVQDWDFWLRLHHAGVIFAGCFESLLLYRVHPNSVSHNALTAVAMKERIYRTHVWPHIPRPKRWLAYNRFRSEILAEAALILRVGNDKRAPAHMLKSIARDPFHDPHRYKVLLHMLTIGLIRRGKLS